MSRKVGLHRHGDGDLTRYRRGGNILRLPVVLACTTGVVIFLVSKQVRSFAFVTQQRRFYEKVHARIWMCGIRSSQERESARAGAGGESTCGKCKTFKNGNSLISKSLKSLILSKYNIWSSLYCPTNPMLHWISFTEYSLSHIWKTI